MVIEVGRSGRGYLQYMHGNILLLPPVRRIDRDARVASKHQQRLGKIEEETEKTNQEKRVATAAAVSQYLLPLTRNNEELVGVEL